MEAKERFQDNLLLIRSVVGWSAKEFGERIGVTRQTINNLEAKPKDGKRRATLTKTQYIAMRAVLDSEMAQSEKSGEKMEMLETILEVLVDNPDKYSKEIRDEVLSKANMMSPSILAGTSSREDVSREYTKLIKGLGLCVAAAALGTWIIKEITDN